MTRFICLLFVLLGLGLSNGCTKDGTANKAVEIGGPSSGSGQKGFLYAGSRGGDVYSAEFIRWTEADKHVSGQIQMFWANGNARSTSGNQGNNPFLDPIGNAQQSFEGVRNGEDISITFTGDFVAFSKNSRTSGSALTGQVWTGTLKGDNLTLITPDPASGTLTATEFKSATVEQYNQVVTNATETLRKK